MSLATSFAVFLLLLLLLGSAILRWAGLRLADGQHLGLALAVGYTALLPVRWLEELAGLPLVLPLVGISCIVLLETARRRAGVPRAGRTPASGGPGLPGVVDERLRPSGPARRLPRLSRGLRRRPGHLRAVRPGDREEPAAVPENPLFAGIRSGYSSFPSLLGLLIHDYAPASLLTIFLAHLPALALLSLGLCLDGLLEGHGSRLQTGQGRHGVADGPRRGPLLAGRRAQLDGARPHQPLPGLPFVRGRVAVLQPVDAGPAAQPGRPSSRPALAARGRRSRAVPRRRAPGRPWQTKVFACLPLLAGAWIAALLLRQRRLLALALAATAGAAPWAALTLLAGPG